jgi:3-oxoacyl-[acyl-carrier-protein] synthase II
VDLVVAHGTGTALNDPMEASVLRAVFGDTDRAPLVTAIKGGIGHTSGVAALHSLAIAAESMRRGLIPSVVGLREPLPDAKRLRLVRDTPVSARPTIAMINAFGFGGVNAVTLLEAVR